VDTLANLLQIYESSLKGFLLAVAVAAAISLGQELVPAELQNREWARAAWFWARLGGGALSGVVFLFLWWSGENLILNGSFTDANRHWGTGYYEDLLRNGNWDTRETIENYKKAMAHYPYILHMPRPARPAETDPVPDSNGQLDYVRGGVLGLGGRHAFKIEFRADEGRNRFGTLSQRLCNLKPHHNYRATFLVRAESYTPGALRLTALLNWRPCEIVEMEKLNTWEKKTCGFETGDTDQVDLRFFVQAPARVWVTGIKVHED